LCRYLARSSRVKLRCSTSSPIAYPLSTRSTSHNSGVPARRHRRRRRWSTAVSASGFSSAMW
jgi:hypothetical protein